MINTNKERRTVVGGLGRGPRIARVFTYPKGNNVTGSTRYIGVDTASLGNVASFTIGVGVSFYMITPSSPLMLKLISVLRDGKVPYFNPSGGTTVVRKDGIFSGGLVGGCNVPATNCRIFSSPRRTLSCVGRGGRCPAIVGTSNLTLKGNIVVTRSRRRTRSTMGAVVRSGGFNSDKGGIIVRRFLANPRISILSFASKGAMIPVISSVSRGHTLSNSGKLGANKVKAITPGPCCATRVTGRYTRGVFLPAIGTVGGRGEAFGNYLCFNLVLAPGNPGIVRCGYHFNSPRARIILPLLGASLLAVVHTIRSRALSFLGIRFGSRDTTYIIVTSNNCPLSCNGNCRVSFNSDRGARGIAMFRTNATRGSNGVIASNNEILKIATAKGSLGTTLSATCGTARRVGFGSTFCEGSVNTHTLTTLGGWAKDSRVMCEVCIRGGGRFTSRTTSLLSSVHSLLVVSSLRRLHVFGECSIRGVDRRLFRHYRGAIFSRPRLSGACTHLPRASTAMFTIRCLPNRFSRETSSYTRYVRVISRNSGPAIHATGMCVLFNGLTPTRLRTVGGCMVGPMRDHRTSLRGPRALGIGCVVPANIMALAKFARLGRSRLGTFVSGCTLTVSLTSVRFYHGCFGNRRHSPAVARVEVVSAC